MAVLRFRNLHSCNFTNCASPEQVRRRHLHSTSILPGCSCSRFLCFVGVLYRSHAWGPQSERTYLTPPNYGFFQLKLVVSSSRGRRRRPATEKVLISHQSGVAGSASRKLELSSSNERDTLGKKGDTFLFLVTSAV